jgi:protein-S-isoprenylcysteine O-methyltransferase Ste14
MLMLLRHLIATAVLPFTMTVLIPVWIARWDHVVLRMGSSTLEIMSQLGGLAIFAIGLFLFGTSLWYFAIRGRGTLAPWDPPRHLVVEGPYRYVRNPMISGVIFILFGEALVFLSWPHTRWALLFLVINLIYIPLLEEPMLEARFGDSYRVYRRHVWRFLPRIRPWIAVESRSDLSS